MDSKCTDNWRMVQDAIQRQKRNEYKFNDRIGRDNSSDPGNHHRPILFGADPSELLIPLKLSQYGGDDGTAESKCTYTYTVLDWFTDDPYYDATDPQNPEDDPHFYERWALGSIVPANRGLGFIDDQTDPDNPRLVITWINETENVSACEPADGYEPGTESDPIQTSSNFNGTDNAIDFQSGNLVDLDGTSFAVSTTIRLDEIRSGRIFQNRGIGSFGTVRGWQLQTDSTGILYFAADLGNGTYNRVDYGVLTTGQTYDVGGVWDSTTGTATIAVDGVVAAQQTIAAMIGANLNALDWRVGASNTDSQYWIGRINDVRFYNGVTSWPPPQTNLIHHWPIQDGSGTNIENIVSPGDAGTLVGDATDFWGTTFSNPQAQNTFRPSDFHFIGFGSDRILDLNARSFSITGVFTADSNTGNNGRILQNRGTGSSGTKPGFFIYHNSAGAIRFQVETDNGTDVRGTTPDGTLVYGQQYVFDCQWDSTTGTATLILNGTTYTETNAAGIGGNVNSENWVLGASSDSGNRQYHSGSIYDIKVWDGVGPTRTLVNYWPLTDGSGTVIADLAGTFPGTLFGNDATFWSFSSGVPDPPVVPVP